MTFRVTLCVFFFYMTESDFTHADVAPVMTTVIIIILTSKMSLHMDFFFFFLRLKPHKR